MVDKRTKRSPRVAGDVPHAGSSETMLSEQTSGDVEDVLLGLNTLGIADSFDLVGLLFHGVISVFGL